MIFVAVVNWCLYKFSTHPFYGLNNLWVFLNDIWINLHLWDLGDNFQTFWNILKQEMIQQSTPKDAKGRSHKKRKKKHFPKLCLKYYGMAKISTEHSTFFYSSLIIHSHNKPSFTLYRRCICNERRNIIFQWESKIRPPFDWNRH